MALQLHFKIRPIRITELQRVREATERIKQANEQQEPNNERAPYPKQRLPQLQASEK